MSLISVDLPEPDTPVTQMNSPTGRSSVDVLQVVAARADDSAAGAADWPARVLAARRSTRRPARYAPVSDAGLVAICAGRALGDDVAAVLAGARAHVDDVVGRSDGLLVVLDHDHRVAEVAQVLERVEQACVVALVQADRRFVQHVHDAGQAGADLRREADALRLAAGERLGRAVERQVVEADVDQEAIGATRSP